MKGPSLGQSVVGTHLLGHVPAEQDRWLQQASARCEKGLPAPALVYRGVDSDDRPCVPQRDRHSTAATAQHVTHKGTLTSVPELAESSCIKHGLKHRAAVTVDLSLSAEMYISSDSIVEA